MNPQSPLPQPEQNPLDYLNSIAAKPQARLLSPVKLWGAIGGGLLVVVILFFVIMSLARGNSPTDKFSQYQYRLSQLSSISTTEANKLDDTNLRALNGSMNTILVGASTKSNELLPYFGLKKSVQPAKDSPIVKEFTDLRSKLDDSDLNNTLDQVYAREMAYQMSALLTLIQSIEKSSGSDVRSALEATATNITPYIKQYDSFNNAQG